MRRHGLGCHADRLLTAAIDFVRCGGVGEGFRHRDRRRSCASRSCTNGSCASGVVLVLEATELGCLERGLLVSLAVGLRERQFFGRTMGLHAGLAFGLGLEGGLRGLRSELGRTAAGGSPLRQSLRGSSSFGGSCLGSHKSSTVLLRNRSTGGGW